MTFTTFQRQMAAMFLQRYKDLAKNSVRNRSYPCIPETWDVSLDGIQADLLIVEETGETVELGTLPGCRYAVQEVAFVADWSAYSSNPSLDHHVRTLCLLKISRGPICC